MKFDLAYCWPRGEEFLPFAYRFLTSFCQFPPSVEHRLIVLTDPGPIDGEFDLARTLPNVHFFQCAAPGKDLSRYFAYAEQTDADLIMCLGGTSYCRKAGWGLRMATAWQRLGGLSLLGACGNTGAANVRPHVRTTGFAIAPSLLRRYPIRPQNHAERYQVEHGTGCLSDWIVTQGGQCWIINFGSEFPLSNAQGDPNGYARGNHSALLIGDRLTREPFFQYA